MVLLHVQHSNWSDWGGAALSVANWRAVSDLARIRALVSFRVFRVFRWETKRDAGWLRHLVAVLGTGYWNWVRGTGTWVLVALLDPRAHSNL